MIEGEWTQTAGAESAAQAYEYARRIMSRGTLADGAFLFGLDPNVVKKAPFHALVVANLLIAGCHTAQKLRVERMDYFDFADLLKSKDFAGLKQVPKGD